MKTIYLGYADSVIQIDHPFSLSHLIKIVFPQATSVTDSNTTDHMFVSQINTNRYSVYCNQHKVSEELPANECILWLCNKVIELIAKRCRQVIAFHAAAVGCHEKAIILPAKTGGGKTSMAAWLTSQGYHYLTDELVLYDPLLNEAEIEAVYRPLNVKASGLEAIRHIQQQVTQCGPIETSAVTLMPCINDANTVKWRKRHAALFIFPKFTPGSDIQIEPLSAAQAGLELMACNVNARNFENHGFTEIASMARRIPAFRLTYSKFSQLDGIIAPLIELILSSSLDMRFLDKLQKSGNHHAQLPKDNNTLTTTMPDASPKGPHKKLCIGMATYDDYDGVYFTVQAIRLYHADVLEDVEFLIIDNHPTGKCAHALKAMDKKIDNLRYVPVVERTGTAVRECVFKQANSDFVLCVDCHVFIQPGAIRQLLDYIKDQPDCGDLLQGPMYSDNLMQLHTHFEPVWQNGMYGVWAQDQRALDENAPAFDIPMQGLGLFACKKQIWPGLNKQFRGFGGEEGYLHEKFRRAGGRTLCLPFLRWMHRFERPMGVPYSVNWADRIRNYIIGFRELGMEIEPVINHFSEHIGKQLTDSIVHVVEAELDR